MNKKIIDNIFLITCICLPFFKIPTILQMKFLAGTMGTNLIIYPLFVGFIYTIRYCYKKKELPSHFKIIIKFLLAYIGILTLSTLAGLYMYPYYDLAFSKSVPYSDKLSLIFYFLSNHGISIKENTILMFGLFAVKFVGILLEAFWYFGTAYLIYYWYREDWRRGARIFCNGIIIGLCIFVIYGMIDMLYLMRNQTAKWLLTVLNPCIYEIGNIWPPILWENQLRSIFVEPSYVGNYLAVALPIVWLLYLRFSNKKILILDFITTVLAIFTQSRTAYAMIIFTFVCAVLFVIAIKQKYFYRLFIIVTFTIIAFIIGTQIINTSIGVNPWISSNINRTSSEVVNDNLFSLGDSKQRSNKARYAYMGANLRTFEYYPLLGVGRGLATEYNIEHFTDEERKIWEISRNINLAEKNGVLHANILGTALNEYITRLAQNGILGLIVFLFPFAYCFFQMLKIIYYKPSDDNLWLLFILLISSLLAANNTSINIVPSGFIILGLCYASLEK